MSTVFHDFVFFCAFEAATPSTSLANKNIFGERKPMIRTVLRVTPTYVTNQRKVGISYFSFRLVKTENDNYVRVGIVLILFSRRILRRALIFLVFVC